MSGRDNTSVSTGVAMVATPMQRGRNGMYYFLLSRKLPVKGNSWARITAILGRSNAQGTRNGDTIEVSLQTNDRRVAYDRFNEIFEGLNATRYFDVRLGGTN